jgi:asparagine synthase (glutamine-hydrolysing)
MGHRFASDSDTEAIVHAYEQYGDRCCALLEGDFAFAIYDQQRRRILLARDRVGIKPLYYTFVHGRLAFASEIKALLAIPGVQRKVNTLVFDRYLALRYPFGRETMFDGIFRLLPSEMLSYECASQRVKRAQYWQMDWTPKQQSEAVLVAELRKALDEAVERQQMSDVPLGAYLSGGVDSASIVSLMARQVDKPIKTFSVGFGSEDADELAYAKRMSEHLGTDHREILVDLGMIKLLPEVVWHSDEPIADPAMIPVYVLSQHAKKRVTVVLTGDGGDELFAGYEQQKFLRLAQRCKAVPGLRSAIALGLGLCPPAALTSIFKYARVMGSQGIKRAQQLLRANNPVQQYLAITSIFSAKERGETSPRTRLNTERDLRQWFTSQNTVVQDSLRFEFDVQLPENMLMKTDRMSLAHAVEARVPLLDTKVLAVAGRIPLSWKLRGNTEKYIFRKAMAPLLPKIIAQRKKQRFYVPINDWLVKCRPLLDRLFAPEMLRHGLLDARAIQRIRDKYRNAPLFYARQLWSLLTFQLWYEQFILGEKRAP